MFRQNSEFKCELTVSKTQYDPIISIYFILSSYLPSTLSLLSSTSSSFVIGCVCVWGGGILNIGFDKMPVNVGIDITMIKVIIMVINVTVISSIWSYNSIVFSTFTIIHPPMSKPCTAMSSIWYGWKGLFNHFPLVQHTWFQNVYNLH